MKYILIRDDDLNFFTPFEELKTVYGFMFEQGIPVNFSTIPAVNGAAKTLSNDKKKEVFEPFLPDAIAGTKGSFYLSDNTNLLSSLKDIPNNEFLLHGFEHSGNQGRCEFEIDDSSLLLKKLLLGKKILTDCFGIEPRTFVAPQDKYSRQAIELIKSRFDTFSLGWIDRKRLPNRCLPSYAYKKLKKENHIHYGKLLMTEHPGCHYSKYVPREISDTKLSSALKEHTFTIIVTHHWEFFNSGQLNKVMWSAFKNRVEQLNADKETQFIRFSELYQLMA
jgi:peptidoglycan/xylan/chitin deacetylase (PgdA/CDA1 family)